MDIIENLLKRDLKTNNNKTQIVITHTSRNKLDYLQSLKYRLNKNYGKVPHYTT